MMAEEWSKLEADYKKLEQQIKKSTFAQADRLWQALLARDKLMDGHEKLLTKAAQVAFEKGVTGKTVVEFMKDKGFGDAKKLLDTDRRLLVNELYELKVYCEACDALAKVMDKLSEKMAKAIKLANDPGPAGVKATKLRLELALSLKDVNEAAALRFKPDKYMTSFNQQYDKLLGHMLTEALKQVSEAKDDDALPQPLVEKQLQAVVVQSEKLRVGVTKALDEALAATAKDPKAAAAPLKKAATALGELKKLAMRYQGLRTKFKKDIAGSKERTDIEGRISEIVANFEAAETQFKAKIAKLKA